MNNEKEDVAGASGDARGLEQALQAHPLMIQAKTMAKKLAKALREVDPGSEHPLMKAQEVAARQLGHDHLKALREKCLSDILEARVAAAGGLEILGAHARTGLTRCELGSQGAQSRLALDWESFRRGALVVGDGAEDVSTGIACESIRTGRGLTWVDARGGPSKVAELIEAAKAAGRLEDVVVVGAEHGAWPKGVKSMPWSSTIKVSAQQMLEFLGKGMEQAGSRSEAAMAWLSALLPPLCCMRDSGQLLLGLDFLLDFGIFELVKMGLRRDLPEAMRLEVRKYLESIGVDPGDGWSGPKRRDLDPKSVRLQREAMAPVKLMVDELSGHMGDRWVLSAPSLASDAWLPHDGSILLIDLPGPGAMGWCARWAKACLVWSYLAQPWRSGGGGARRLLVARDLPPAAEHGALSANWDSSSVATCHAWSSVARLEEAVGERWARRREGIRAHFDVSLFAKGAAAQAWAAHRAEWPSIQAEDAETRLKWEWARSHPPEEDWWTWMEQGHSMGPWVARVGSQTQAFNPSGGARLPPP